MYDLLSTRDVARRFGVPLPSAVKAIVRIGCSQRIGRNRDVKAEDLPRIEAALRGLGALKPPTAPPNHPELFRIAPLAPAPPAGRPVVTVAAMLAGLKSTDLVTRLEAGVLLAQSIAAGLAVAGEHGLDVEHLLAPQISDLLGKAMYNADPAAVAELERVLTNDFARARRPDPVEA
jgi:hypothetical protein